MRKHYWLLCLFAWSAFAQKPDTTFEPVVVDSGPHHRVIQQRVVETLADGRTRERIRSYTAVGTGLNYFDPETRQYRATEEIIEIIRGAAVANRGPHKVSFAENANSPGAITLDTPDGKRFRSHVTGLAYTDSASGRSVMIAELRDTIGALVPPNRVIYADAFAGDCRADIRYTYTAGGLEQDIIIFRSPPPPEAWGLPSQTTRLECFTEFIEMPAGNRTEVILNTARDREQAKRMVEPDLIDQHLDFGAFKMPTGYVFPVGAELTLENGIPTGKSIDTIEGRTFLIERVDYSAIQQHLTQLPQAAAVRKKNFGLPGPRRMMAGILPAAPKGNPGKWKETQVAKVDLGRPGLVLDYTAINGSMTNVTFLAGETYYITNTVFCYGTTVLESAILKFRSGAHFYNYGPIQCRTTPWRSAVLTARDDNTIGQPLLDSTGSPSGLYAGYAIVCLNTASRYDIHDVQIRYANYGLLTIGAIKADLTNVRISKGNRGIGWNANTDIAHRNVLFSELTTALLAVNLNTTNRFEHATFHKIGSFLSATNASVIVAMTNCLLISVTNNVAFQEFSNVATNLSDSGVFQTVGNGAYYLSDTSPYRDIGATNLSAAVLRVIRQGTTYKPVVLTNNFTNNSVLAPVASRDTNVPDLGYHYPPLDYCWTGLKVINARLTLTNGVVVGTYGPDGSYAIGMERGSELMVFGSPSRLSRLVRYNLVQEQAAGPWATNSVGALVQILTNGPVAPKIQMRFAECVVPDASAGYQVIGFDPWPGVTVGCRDSHFAGGFFGGIDVGTAFTNCVLDRVFLDVEGSDCTVQRYFAHNLFRNGAFWIIPSSGCSVTARNNLFDAATIVQSGTWTHGWNGYFTNQPGQVLASTGSTDKFLTNAMYETGALGWFYYSTNGATNTLTSLANGGSTNAHLLGFSHYTTATNQTKEGTSLVDIGFRYVATDSAGEPLDSDGDGVADYFEDVNGDGSWTTGELNFLDPDTDYDGRHDGQELGDGTDPTNSASVQSVQLGRWRFNTSSWAGEQGQMPKAATNLQLVTSWSSNAVLVATNVAAYLKYNDLNGDRTANINCRSGTVRFWFRAKWASTNAGGAGPGGWGNLVAMGIFTNTATYGYWGIGAGAAGTNLLFVTQSNGVTVTNIQAAISWIPTNWHQVAVTYTPTSSALYVDGQPLVSNGAGITRYPTAGVRSADGFYLGSSREGLEQGGGRYDELETFNYALTAQQILNDFLQVMNGDEDGDGIALMSDANPNSNGAGAGVVIEKPRDGQVIR